MGRGSWGHAVHEFEQSDEFMDAYADYVDSFHFSPIYDRAFERWLAENDCDPDVESDLYADYEPEFLYDLKDDNDD